MSEEDDEVVAQRRLRRLRPLLVVIAALLFCAVVSMSGLMIFALLRGAKETTFDPVFKQAPPDRPPAPLVEPPKTTARE